MPLHILDGATLRPPGARAVPTQCLLIEQPDGLVAVDAGLSQALLVEQAGLSFERYFIRPPHRPEIALINQVRALGYDPRDVRDIVVTHLHSEHAGGIMDFPHARVHVARTEYDIANNGSRRSRLTYRHGIWAHGPRWELHRPNTTWFDVPGATAITGDLILVPLPGHTLGHCGVAVRTGAHDWLLHAGDAAYGGLTDGTPARYPLRQYQWFSAVDRRLAHRTRHLLDRLTALPHVQVICSHQPTGPLPAALTVNRSESQ